MNATIKFTKTTENNADKTITQKKQKEQCGEVNRSRAVQ